VSFGSRVRKGFGSMFSFFGDSVSELKKVRWPNKKELTSYTIVVLVTVIFVTIYFTILDFGISNLVRLLVD